MTAISSFRLFCFGLGFSARELAARKLATGWHVAGTGRQPADGPPAKYRFQRGQPVPAAALADISHVLISIPPDGDGDPVLAEHGSDLASLRPRWIGYLSTTGVYGDHKGGWVDEDTPPTPGSQRSRWRLAAEHAWQDFGARHGLNVQIFRLAGIYGPGRSVFDRLRDGRARRIDKPGQFFGRIHVADIANTLEAAMERGRAGRIYNVADDEPGPPDEPLLHAARLLGLPDPPLVPLADADLSPMAASFYAENRRVRNQRLHEELGVTLSYPDYRAGLAAIYQTLQAPPATGCGQTRQK